jgi:hypothetical protein
MQFVSHLHLRLEAGLTDRTLHRWSLLLDSLCLVDRHDGLQVLRQFDQGGSRILCRIKAERLGSQGTPYGCKLRQPLGCNQLTNRQTTSTQKTILPRHTEAVEVP